MAVAEQRASNPLTVGLERLPVHPTTLTIFGATGDLAKRKLLPALYNLAQCLRVGLEVHRHQVLSVFLTAWPPNWLRNAASTRAA